MKESRSKRSQNCLFDFFFFNFWPHHVACRIPVPWPGIKPTPLAKEAQSLNHWTTREVLGPWFCDTTSPDSGWCDAFCGEGEPNVAVTEEATLENFSLPSCQGQENILALHSEGGRLENPDANSFIHLYIQRCFLSACYCRAGPVLNAKDDSQGQHRQGPSALVPRWRNK